MLGTAVAVVGGYYALKSGRFQQIVVKEISQKISDSGVQNNVIQDILGFKTPKTYLVLFLNNTEMRPGGGFIGAYAVVRVDKSTPSLLKVEGTEILDNLGKKDFTSEAPTPIKKYLKVDRWYFRDSNWSPDFASSSAKSLELYRKQGGEYGDQIDAVIGFTPTVMEEILKIHGPVQVNGQEFNSQNFTEQLEYEVEYGFKNKGVEFKDRKSMLADLAGVMVKSLAFDVVTHSGTYMKLAEKMIAEKHLVVYSPENILQDEAVKKNLDGQMRDFDGDYLLWADANLGALKTDVVLKKELFYSITLTGTGKYLATAKMKITHNGKFDWRISRYRDYARVFAPKGSQLVRAVGAMDMEKSTKVGTVDSGEENGKQWFGAFVAVEPGKIGELSFEYYLPENVVAKIKNKQYNLLVQKELGAVGVGLTLGLDFGINVMGANITESPNKYGDTRYDLISDLNIDREFSVQLK